MTDSENIETRILVAKKVYDPFLRFLHWWNALSIFSLMLTIWLKHFLKPFQNWKEIIYHFHVLIGYALTVGILARIIWGIIGPKYAQFKNMFQVKDYIFILKNKKIEQSEQWGHNRYAGLIYIILYLLMIYEIYSGLYLAAKYFSMGPFSQFISFSKDKDSFSILIKDIHEIIFYLTMGFALLHMFMLIFQEVKEKYPITQSIFSGFQYRIKEKNIEINKKNN